VAGNDTLDGGAGVDSASYGFAPSGVVVDLAAGTGTGNGSDTLIGIENLEGSFFADTVIGDLGPNVISGGSGDDTVRGWRG
jgi:Ca2+-binding RTX toxin-like protein